MMRSERKSLLDSSLLPFSQELKIDDVLIQLQSNGIFTGNVVEKITSLKVPQDSRRALIREVKVRGDVAFDELFLALVMSRQDKLAALLRPLVDETVIQSIENMPNLLAPSSSSSQLDTSSKCDSWIDDSPMELCGVMENLSVEMVDGPDWQKQLEHYERNKANIYSHFTNPKGLCLLISNEKFLTLPHRPGTQVDEKNLTKLFRQLGYRVILKSDLTGKEMSSCIEQFGQDPLHVKSSSTVVIVLTHGEKGVLFGVDGEPVSIEYTLSFLNSTNAVGLASKPKFIILQACRGDRYDKGFVSVDETDGAHPQPDGFKFNPFGCISGQAPRQQLTRQPQEADFLIAYATPSTYVSWRNIQQGSWFVQAICEVFGHHAKTTEVSEMLVMVNRRVSQNQTNSGNTQMPEYCNRLRKRFFLYPSGPERSSAV